MKTANRKGQRLSERFEVAFNQVHNALRAIVKIHDDRFSVLLKAGAKKYRVIETFKKDLEQYARLRNAIVHEKTEIGYYIAEPNEKVVHRIEQIASILSKPNDAYSIGTKKVVVFDERDSILQVITAIKERGYSKFPVYHGKKCVGLLTAGSIVKWMAQNMEKNLVNLADILVSDVMKYEKEHQVDFISKQTNIYELENLFENAHKRKTKLEAVIVTLQGNPDEKPIGIITPWDLIDIDYSLD